MHEMKKGVTAFLCLCAVSIYNLLYTNCGLHWLAPLRLSLVWNQLNK